MHVYDHLCRRHHDDHHAVPNDDCVSDDPIDIICWKCSCGNSFKSEMVTNCDKLWNNSSPKEQHAHPFCNSINPSGRDKLLVAVVSLLVLLLERVVVVDVGDCDDCWFSSNLASIFTEATSLTTTATLYPCRFCNKCCNKVVFPDPKNLLKIVIGMMLDGGGLFFFFDWEEEEHLLVTNTTMINATLTAPWPWEGRRSLANQMAKPSRSFHELTEFAKRSTTFPTTKLWCRDDSGSLICRYFWLGTTWSSATVARVDGSLEVQLWMEIEVQLWVKKQLVGRRPGMHRKE